jgi:hypothetical protein
MQAEEDSVSDTSFTTAADDMVNSAIMGALLGSDRTQLQDESEASQSTATAADEASTEAADEADADEETLVARALSNVVPEHLSLMKGSMDAADWSEFDQLAEQREGTDSPLSWSLVVCPTHEQVFVVPCLPECFDGGCSSGQLSTIQTCQPCVRRKSLHFH